MCAALNGQYLYVACETYHRVLVVRLLGNESKVVSILGGPGESPGRFDHPKGVSLSSDGSLIFVADSMNQRVQVIEVPANPEDPNASFTVIRILGKFGEAPGEFRGIFEAKVSSDGSLVYVTDSGHSIVQVLCAHCGTHVHTIGGRRSGSFEGRFVVPYGIALGKRAGQDVLVVSDCHDGRIQTFTVPPSTGAGDARATGDANAPIVLLE